VPADDRLELYAPATGLVRSWKLQDLPGDTGFRYFAGAKRLLVYDGQALSSWSFDGRAPAQQFAAPVPDDQHLLTFYAGARFVIVANQTTRVFTNDGKLVLTTDERVTGIADDHLLVTNRGNQLLVRDLLTGTGPTPVALGEAGQFVEQFTTPCLAAATPTTLTIVAARTRVSIRGSKMVAGEHVLISVDLASHAVTGSAPLGAAAFSCDADGFSNALPATSSASGPPRFIDGVQDTPEGTVRHLALIAGDKGVLARLVAPTFRTPMFFETADRALLLVPHHPGQNRDMLVLFARAAEPAARAVLLPPYASIGQHSLLEPGRLWLNVAGTLSVVSLDTLRVVDGAPLELPAVDPFEHGMARE
jgi:hypothetical protein